MMVLIVHLLSSPTRPSVRSSVDPILGGNSQIVLPFQGSHFEEVPRASASGRIGRRGGPEWRWCPRCRPGERGGRQSQAPVASKGLALWQGGGEAAAGGG